MTIIDCCIGLKMIKKNLAVLGVVDMRQLLLNRNRLIHVEVEICYQIWQQILSKRVEARLPGCAVLFSIESVNKFGNRQKFDGTTEFHPSTLLSTNDITAFIFQLVCCPVIG